MAKTRKPMQLVVAKVAPLIAVRVPGLSMKVQALLKRTIPFLPLVLVRLVRVGFVKAI